jgi:type II restriction/modification system DNA methylase subunit YeeA
MTVSLTPQAFVDKWRHAELKERSAYQQHFLDLCRLINHPAPADIDPKGDFFTFEAGASKVAGGDGFADVWYKGHFGWEYKGKHGNLDKAYQQLLQYREALENPPLLIVSDIGTIVIHTNFTNTVKRKITLTLEDLLTNDGLATLEKVFRNPEALRSDETSDGVTQKAAIHFAKLAEALRIAGYPNQQVAQFLIRLLFCLFAEDVGLLPPRLFSNLIRSFRNHPKTFTKQLGQLFEAMSTGGAFGMEMILHFDGRLFDNAEVLEIGVDGLDMLQEVARLDWSNIEPSIFGTLFERSLDPTKRSQLGAHYTSKEDILLIVEPVLMAPLRRKWETVQMEARELADQRDAAKGTKRAGNQKKLSDLLTGFSQEIAAIKVLDPACGSGNFLYVALRQLLNLQKEVITLAGSLQVGSFFPSVTPEQLHGIEINEYAHQLAQATIQIGYIQWLRENGFGFPAEPILKPLDNIWHMDAILAYDQVGKPVEPEWPTVNVILGNPPFLGGNKIRKELGDIYINNLFNLYTNRIPAFSDFVCYWFEKSRKMIETGVTQRAGLLATQSIRGGVNRTVLERIKNSGEIFWAISDRDWVLNGATVHVSIVCFDNSQETNRFLDFVPVVDIHTDLTSTINITRAKLLLENQNLSFQGPSPKGPFDINYEIAKELLIAPININGKTNDNVVRPVVSAIDIGQRNRGKWTIDFALMSYDEASQFEKPFEYVKKAVYPIRKTNRRQAYCEKWWLYAEARPGMRQALRLLDRFITTPRVSKHRIFIWLPKNVLSNDGTIVIARSDDYFFGILHSKPHELWSRATGTQLREAISGFRYTPTSTFETFPWPPGKEPVDDPRVQSIAQAAKELVDKRDAWLNPSGASEAELKKRTLTNLYNQRPSWLELAHQKLDQAVFAAYGWPDDLLDEEILEKLLSLNLQRSKKK